MVIGIIGLGYVGLTLAIAAADCGIKTYGVEVNPKIKDCLKENRAHFFEPGLDSLIEKHNNKMFFCVDDFPTDVKYDAFIVTVGTPLKHGESVPNFEYIKSALLSVKEVYTGDELFILRSTVSVGTTRNVVMPYLAQLCNVPQENILVSFCPERTVEGKAIDELKNLPQIISGNNEKSLEIAQNVFRKITPYVVEAKSLEEAELAKLYCNTYRDITFALGNVFCMAAQTFGVDGLEVIKTANRGYQRSNICLPGFVAGPCLEKDAYILTNNMEECASKDFILGARKFNESLEDIVVNWVERKAGKGNPDKVIVLSGMAFKGIPETSDLRGSSSVYIARKLKAKGYTLHLHDFVADMHEMQELGLGDCFSNLKEAVKNANVLLVLNNHRKYASVQPEDVYLEKFIPVLDAWNVCSTLKNRNADICNLGNLYIDK